MIIFYYLKNREKKLSEQDGKIIPKTKEIISEKDNAPSKERLIKKRSELEYYIFLSDGKMLFNGKNLIYNQRNIPSSMILEMLLVNLISKENVNSSEVSMSSNKNKFGLKVKFRKFDWGNETVLINMSEVRDDSVNDFLEFMELFNENGKSPFFDEGMVPTSIENSVRKVIINSNMANIESIQSSNAPSDLKDQDSLTKLGKFQELKNLKQNDLITEEEYQKCKEELLQKILKSS